eukprot:TRINITY_DN1628_c0_g1_i2.p1 TRINITY_DN1628_c0_g1~~TRINITY_DN1628_c0_g1_i2.p1  ORF type:complete len:3387 (+),score=920.26 TRINITY_DN1628_c0_g1_i2:713-10162(+)
MTFTPQNWNVPQTVTLTGQQDDVHDNSTAYNVTVGPPVCDDPRYSGTDVVVVRAANDDDDESGVTVTPTSGLITCEKGCVDASFFVKLDSEPTADVVISFNISDSSEVRVVNTSITLTSADWNVPHRVFVAGVDDDVDDDDQPFTVGVKPAVSADPRYDGHDGHDVTGTNRDDDTAAFRVTPVCELITTEEGGDSTFSVVLESEPVYDVNVTVKSSDTTEGTVSPELLVFTAADWDTPQTVTATGVDDNETDCDVIWTAQTTAASNDTKYAKLNPADPKVINRGLDRPCVQVGNSTCLVTSEAGAFQTFEVSLNRQPTGAVTVPIEGDFTEGWFSTNSSPVPRTGILVLNFTPSNWNVVQTVTVHGVDEDPAAPPNQDQIGGIDDDDVAYEVVTGPAAGGGFDGATAVNVSVTNLDDDAARVVVSPLTITTREANAPEVVHVSVSLTSRPENDVVVEVSGAVNTLTAFAKLPSDFNREHFMTSDNDTAAAPRPDYLRFNFTPELWMHAQTITITSLDDLIDDDDIVSAVTCTPFSVDARYGGLGPQSVFVTNVDNDTAAILPAGVINTTEPGNTSVVEVTLATEPIDTVTVKVLVSDATEAVTDPAGASLVFNRTDWNVSQSVTIVGVDDWVDDDDQPYVVTFAGSGGDPKYAALSAPVAGTNVDNDTAGVTVGPLAGLVTAENGSWTTFTVVLHSEPTDGVTVLLSVNDSTEGKASTRPQFSPANWNSAQTVTVTGINDCEADGDVPYSVNTVTISNSDRKYDNWFRASVQLVNLDEDAPGITVTPTTGLTTSEAGTSAQFSVILATIPAADVTVSMASSDPGEGSVAAEVVFTPTSCTDLSKTITVVGVDDDPAFIDGDTPYTVTLTATSSDSNYDGYSIPKVNLVNKDDDVAGVVVSPLRVTTSENGANATFTVHLMSQPTMPVVFEITSNDTTEATVWHASYPGKMQFTPTDWMVKQTVTVTGVDDDPPEAWPVDTGAFRVVLHTIGSLDLNYQGVDPPDVDGNNIDNDSPGIVIDPMSVDVRENGQPATVAVSLQTRPATTVTVTLTAADESEVSVNPGSLLFTRSEWDRPHTVTVFPADDPDVDGNVTSSVAAVSSSADPEYDGLTATCLATTNDDDSAGVVVSPTAGVVTTEAGASARISFVLTARPRAGTDVSIAVTLNDSTEAKFAQPGVGGTAVSTWVRFTAADWNVSQDVTVTGVDDYDIDGGVPYEVGIAVQHHPSSTSPDPDFLALGALAPVAATNLDNDRPGFAVSPSAITTTEDGGAATVEVVLLTHPNRDVNVSAGQADAAEGTVSNGDLRFTPDNWNVSQTVTVAGVDDDVIDGDAVWTLVFRPASSHDADYAGVTPSAVTVTNTDNDAAGVVLSASMGSTSEAGANFSFTVALASSPVGQVNVYFDSKDSTEGRMDVPWLGFTSANWNVPQTATVTGVDDKDLDGDVSYGVGVGVYAPLDPNYRVLKIPDITVVNEDDDVAGVVVTPGRVNVSEAGSRADLHVSLVSRPQKNVVLTVAVTDSSEGTVTHGSVVFTPSTFDRPFDFPQVLYVVGVDDDDIDGDVNFTVQFRANESADSWYAGMAGVVAEVAVTTLDDDVAGIVLGPPAGAFTSENGGSSDVTVVLTARPAADVTVLLSTNDTSQAVFNTSAVVFTHANWNVPQTVQVVGVDNDVAGPNPPYTVQGRSSWVAPGVDSNVLPGTNSDDDVPGFDVLPRSVETAENGGASEFVLAIHTQPKADVRVPVGGVDASEGFVSERVLVFSPTNWTQRHTVTVTPVDDDEVDGNVTYTLTLGPAQSSDPDYTGAAAGSVDVTNADDDAAGVVVEPPSGVTTEAGGWFAASLRLSARPTADVTVLVTSKDQSEVATSPHRVVFSPAAWSATQTVNISGVDDLKVDGDSPVSVSVGRTSSSDAVWVGLSAPDVDVVNKDDDVAGLSVLNETALVVDEAGGMKAVLVAKLTSLPSADVVVDVLSSNTKEGAVNPAELIFTPAAFDTAQTVTVVGVDEHVDDGDSLFEVDFVVRYSTDQHYRTATARAPVVCLDDDSAGIVAAGDGTTTETGIPANITVRLKSMPLADVVLSAVSSDTALGVVSPAELTIPPADWNRTHVISLTGVDNKVAGPNSPFSVTLGPSVSGDPKYDGVSVAAITATLLDDDVPGVDVVPAAVTTSEAGGVATFAVVLHTQPQADVQFTLSSADDTEGTVSPATLTFTSTTWAVPQTATVTPVDDWVIDGSVNYTVSLSAAVSADTTYSGMVPASVRVTNTDDDAAGIILSPLSGVTAENGSEAVAFDVALTAEPSADVTVGVRCTDETEGAVSASEIVFQPASWNVSQRVTVRGVDDAAVDGDVPYRLLFSVKNPAGDFAGVPAATADLVNTDNDTAGLAVSPTRVAVGEKDGWAAVSVRLLSEPVGEVRVAVRVTDDSEVADDVDVLAFSPENWDKAVVINVTGVDDPDTDGDVESAILLSAAGSADAAYRNLPAVAINVTTIDDDVPGLHVTAGTVVRTNEDGEPSVFVVRLQTRPEEDVIVSVSVNDSGVAAVSPAVLVFTRADWDSPHTVTVRGLDNNASKTNDPFTIRLQVDAGSDSAYTPLPPALVPGTSADNDVPGLVVEVDEPVMVSENGSSGTFTVRLATQPAADVTVAVSSGNALEGRAAPAEVVFTKNNYAAPQTVTVTGVDDHAVDGPRAFNVTVGPVTSADAGYAGIGGRAVAAVNSDDDAVGVAVTPVQLETGEWGSTGVVAVQLLSDPASPVTIRVVVEDATEGTANVTTLVLTDHRPQAVSVAGVDDDVADGPQRYNVSFGPAVSADRNFDGVSVASVSVVNADDEVAGVSVRMVGNGTSSNDTSDLSVCDGEEANLTVRLMSAPGGATATAAVRCTSDLRVSEPGGTPAAEIVLTFSSGNWSAGAPLTLHGTVGAAGHPECAVREPATAGVCTGYVSGGVNASNFSAVAVCVQGAAAAAAGDDAAVVGAAVGGSLCCCLLLLLLLLLLLRRRRGDAERRKQEEAEANNRLFADEIADQCDVTVTEGGAGGLELTRYSQFDGDLVDTPRGRLGASMVSNTVTPQSDASPGPAVTNPRKRTGTRVRARAPTTTSEAGLRRGQSSATAARPRRRGRAPSDAPSEGAQRAVDGTAGAARDPPAPERMGTAEDLDV